MSRTNLARMLAPETLAVVGASEQLAMSNNAVLPMLDAGIRPRMVNPRRDTVYGLPAASSLTELGEPVDAVLALVNAERSVSVVEEAAALGCGGVVVAAAGFTETGHAGRELQQRLQAAARDSGLAVVGPNCSGFRNVECDVNLFTGGRLSLRAGGIAVVSQSGFLTRAALAAGADRQLGFSVGVSTGNEAVCDLADYVAVLADDPHTSVICLVVEKIRRADEFFRAVARARAAGKPVIALKLGRSERGRTIMQSHTGAIAGESWIYDLALREHGALVAHDLDELLDKAALLAQLPRRQWGPLRRVGVLTSSGGVAAAATDLAEGSGLELPAAEPLREWVAQHVPGEGGLLNPLDMTGFVTTRSDLTAELFERYATSGCFDALVLCWWLGRDDEAWGRVLLDPYADAAARSDIPLVVTPVEATGLGDWVSGLAERNLAYGRGLESVYRGLGAVSEFAEATPRDPRPAIASAVASGPGALVETPAGPVVPFAAAMQLLSDCGIPVAPFVVLADGADELPAETTLCGPLVVKLADVPHRTELSAVTVGVDPAELAPEVRRLRGLARAEGVPDTVVVQQLVEGHGEAFAGLQARTDLGPVVLFGLGGVLVEASGRVTGRMAPLDRKAAEELVDEVAGEAAFARFRGRRAWAPGPLVDAVLGLSELWRRSGSWIESVDLNPLIVTDDGVHAVDALLVATSSGGSAQLP